MAVIEVEKKKDLTLITIKGRFTIENKAEFQQAVHDDEEIVKGDIGIDARSMHFIDSSGIGELLKLKVDTNKNNKKIYIYGLNDYISKIFKASRLHVSFVLLKPEDFDKHFPSE